MNKPFGVFLLLAFLIFVIFTSGCAKMPEDSSVTSSGDGNSISDIDKQTSTESVVTLSTPLPTDTPKPRPTFSIPPSDGINVENNYSVIYVDKTTFMHETVSFDYNLIYPPMVFDYLANVRTVTEKKAGTSEFGTKSDFSVTYETPNPLAFYEVVIYDRITDEVVDKYEIPRFQKKTDKGKFKVFESGDYHIEITGNLATIETVISVPPQNLEV